MEKYTCPMHPEVASDKKGRCPKCGMDLVPKSEASSMPAESNTEQSYKPLIIIVALITLVTAALTIKDIGSSTFVFGKSISYFMIGFFLVFSGFKLIDLKGFAQGYSTYDLLARRVFSYGYIYPFIELFFGLSMIFNYQSQIILILEVIIMTFSGTSVAIKVAKKEKFQCACLGTFLKVPLTKVTLIEDFGMALLALIMLVSA
jgi:hypothetical protein